VSPSPSSATPVLLNELLAHLPELKTITLSTKCHLCFISRLRSPFLGFHAPRSTTGKTVHRQDVRGLFIQLIRLLTIECSRHIPCIVVQGRYDVVCPVSFFVNTTFVDIARDLFGNSGHDSVCSEKGVARDRFANRTRCWALQPGARNIEATR
jgi:hypothetical protein